MIQIHNLSVVFDDRAILRDCNAVFGKERVGLVGTNGSGKSTLLDVLRGALAPHKGSVLRDGEIGYLPQRLHIDGTMRVMDILGIAPAMDAWKRLESGHATEEDLATLEHDWDIQSRYETTASLMGIGAIEPERPMATLSGGETLRVYCMRFILHSYTHLLLDEPTNHLDSEGQETIHTLIKNFPGGIIVASHDRSLLARMDRIIEIRDGSLVSYGGNWELYHTQKSLEENAAERHVLERAQELRKLKKQAQETQEKQQRRLSRGKKHAATQRIPRILLGARKDRSQQTTAALKRVHDQRVEASQKELTEVQANRAPERNFTILLPQMEPSTGKVMIDLKKVSHAHPGKQVFNNFTIQIQGGERVALVGANGSGKSTLLKLCAGKTALQEGTLRIASPFGYLDQQTEILRNSDTVYEAFSHFHPETSESKKRIILAEFLFPSAFLERYVSSLSGGERSRLALACLLTCEPANTLLLLDEPTNHMDLYSIETIEAALKAYRGTLVVVSHDKDFLKAIGCSRYINLTS